MVTYLIGVDLGTSSTKAGLYSGDGTLVAEASVEVPILYPQPGVVEQENEDFYTTAAQAIRTVMQQSGADPNEVAAIAYDSQMAGVGSINEDFQPATRFDSWLDMRCEPQINYLQKHHGARIAELTGCAPTCDHGPKMMWWKQEKPADYANIAKFVMPAGFVAGKMTGLQADDAFIDYTFLHFTAAADAKSGTWSDELLGILGIDREKMPKIVEPWHIVGEVTEESAREFGLAPGTIVAAGCGDTAGGCAGRGDRRTRHGVRHRWNCRSPGRQHRYFCSRCQSPRLADHALGDPRIMEPTRLHRRRRTGHRLVS